MASTSDGNSSKKGRKNASRYAIIKQEDGEDAKGEEALLIGFVFQLASERTKNSTIDQFKETKSKIKTYASSKIKHNKREIIKILEEMEEKNIPTEMAKPPGYDQMDEWDKDNAKMDRKAQKEKVQKYVDDKAEVMGIVLNQCSDKMKTRLENLSNYQTIIDNYDLLSLLKEIEQLVHDDTQQLYPTISLVDALGRLFIPQRRNEKLDDYFKIFEQRVTAVKYVSPTFFRDKQLVMSELKITEKEYHELFSKSRDDFEKTGILVENRVLAGIFLRCVNNKTYSSYKNKLYNDLLDGNNNYPSTLLACLRNLQLHRPDHTSDRSNDSNHHNYNQNTKSDEVDEIELKFTEGYNAAQRNWVVIDTGASGSLFCNKDFVENIRTTKQKRTIYSNGGKLTTNKMATLPGYGDVWFHHKAMSNVISVHEAMDRGMFITFENKTILFGTDKSHTVEFKSFKNRIFTFEPGPNNNNFLVKEYSLNFTLKERLAKFTPRQLKGMELARRVYKLVGSPGRQRFFKMISRNQIKNCPIIAG